MNDMDQEAFERALQAAFEAGYEEGFSDRDHHAHRNPDESWAHWLSSDDGKAITSQEPIKS